jgi:hypothetical protein
VTWVWIGRHSESSITYAHGRRLLSARSIGKQDPSPIDEGYSSTFGLGRLVLQVLRLRFLPGLETKRTVLHTQPGPWNRALLQLLPVVAAEVHWPPAFSISESGTTLDELSGRFRTPD